MADDVRQFLLRVYRNNDPSKVKKVDYLMTKYKADYAPLCKQVVKKYRVPKSQIPSSVKRILSTRRSLSGQDGSKSPTASTTVPKAIPEDSRFKTEGKKTPRSRTPKERTSLTQAKSTLLGSPKKSRKKRESRDRAQAARPPGPAAKGRVAADGAKHARSRSTPRKPKRTEPGRSKTLRDSGRARPKRNPNHKRIHSDGKVLKDSRNHFTAFGSPKKRKPKGKSREKASRQEEMSALVDDIFQTPAERRSNSHEAGRDERRADKRAPRPPRPRGRKNAKSAKLTEPASAPKPELKEPEENYDDFPCLILQSSIDPIMTPEPEAVAAGKLPELSEAPAKAAEAPEEPEIDMGFSLVLMSSQDPVAAERDLALPAAGSSLLGSEERHSPPGNTPSLEPESESYVSPDASATPEKKAFHGFVGDGFMPPPISYEEALAQISGQFTKKPRRRAVPASPGAIVFQPELVPTAKGQRSEAPFSLLIHESKESAQGEEGSPGPEPQATPTRAEEGPAHTLDPTPDPIGRPGPGGGRNPEKAGHDQRSPESSGHDQAPLEGEGERRPSIGGGFVQEAADDMGGGVMFFGESEDDSMSKKPSQIFQSGSIEDLMGVMDPVLVRHATEKKEKPPEPKVEEPVFSPGSFMNIWRFFSESGDKEKRLYAVDVQRGFGLLGDALSLSDAQQMVNEADEEHKGYLTYNDLKRVFGVRLSVLVEKE